MRYDGNVTLRSGSIHSGRRLAACFAVAATVTGLALNGVPAMAAPVSVVQGNAYPHRIFPDDFFTVPDPSQLTGKRVNLRAGIDFPNCDGTNYSICDSNAMLNQLDGFDLQPRVTVPFSGPIKLASVNDSNFYIANSDGTFASGMRQLVWDPATNTLAGISDQLLKEHTTYHVRVTSGIQDAAGSPIGAAATVCDIAFTTRSASAELENIRRAMDLPANDPGNAYNVAGITDRKASFMQGGTNDVFPAASVMQRLDQTTTDPNNLTASVIPNLIPPGTAGTFAFGSFESPRYQFTSASAHQDNALGTDDGQSDGAIPAVPTKSTAQPFSKDRLGLILVLPATPPPATGYPVAIYGPGFTRSKYDIFVSADYNAGLGIATIATDPAGHAFGANSKVTVAPTAGGSTTFLGYGRGRDLNGDGVIGDGLNDGVRPTDHLQPNGSFLPSHKPIDGLQSGLVQTVVDNMALARSIEAGMAVPTIGTSGAPVLSKTNIMYYGISFGGIYGSMLMGTDPHIRQGLLNVPGGPIVDIARLSSFRGDLATTLAHGKPNLLNGGPGLNGFTEDLPLHNEAPRTVTHAGAFALQELFGNTNWYDRSGSPETFTPLIRLRPDQWASGYKNVAFQTAYGDGTVPNPTAGNIYRAGQLFDRVVYYRNDKSPTYGSDPHGWLASPTLAGRTSGQQQLVAFLLTGQLVNTNPLWLEVPIADPNNLECLHYPDPQTGQGQSRQPYPLSGSCPAALSFGTPPSGASIAGNGCNALAAALPNTGTVPAWPRLAAAAGAAVLAVAWITALPARRRRRLRQTRN